MKNFHVPLPEKLYQKLRGESDQSKMPATEIVRQIIEDWLRIREKEKLYGDIIAYAIEEGGTKNDLNQDLEEACIEHLCREE